MTSQFARRMRLLTTLPIVCYGIDLLNAPPEDEMDRYSQMQQTIARERRLRYIIACCFPACCFALSLAAAPSQAASTRHRGASKVRGGSKAAHPAVHAHERTIPNVRTNAVGTYRISYVRPHKKSPASVVVFMRLDDWEDVSDGSGSFQKQTPWGQVLVKWHNGQVTVGSGKNDAYGRGISSECAVMTAYTLTIDSPKALPVQLKTQQYSLYAMYLNGRPISKESYFSGLSGEVDGHSPSDNRHHDQHFEYTFPGGHNAIVLQAPGWREE